MSKLAPADYRIHDLLARRWSPRAFSDRPVEESTIKRLFEAARWSPSSYNEQPWAFFVATKDQTEAYAKLLSCLIDFNQGWARAAPVLVITAAHLTLERNGQPNLHAYHDVGSAMAHLTFQATTEGLFVHQMAGIKPPHARTVLKLPEGWDPVSAVVIGYLGDPAILPEDLRKRESADRVRKPQSSFVFVSEWGEIRKQTEES
jgi:nitroreductase